MSQLTIKEAVYLLNNTQNDDEAYDLCQRLSEIFENGVADREDLLNIASLKFEDCRREVFFRIGFYSEKDLLMQAYEIGTKTEDYQLIAGIGQGNEKEIGEKCIDWLRKP